MHCVCFIGWKGPWNQSLSFRPLALPSFCPEVFLGFAQWFFLSRIFQKKFVPKIGKMGQKWTKNSFFWIYWKISSLVFS